jgi:hypothetical protein
MEGTEQTDKGDDRVQRADTAWTVASVDHDLKVIISVASRFILISHILY